MRRMPKRVLVVDDHVDTVQSTVAVFRSAGYDAKGCYNAKDALRAPCRVDDPLPFRCCWRQRFFDHDVFAGFQCRERHGHMQDIRHGDGHRLDVRIRDEILIVSVDARDVELLGQVPAPLFIKTRDGNNLGARDLGETL